MVSTSIHWYSNSGVLAKTFCLGFFLALSSVVSLQVQRQDAQAEYVSSVTQAEQTTIVQPGGRIIDPNVDNVINAPSYQNSLVLSGLAKGVLVVGIILILGSLGGLVYLRIQR